MYLHYEYPDVNSYEQFSELYSSEDFNSDKFRDDLERAMETSPVVPHIQQTIGGYNTDSTGQDAIMGWIERSDERDLRGIFGFTVPVLNQCKRDNK